MLDSSHSDFARWTRANNMVMSWLLNSIYQNLAHTVLYADFAATIWADLKSRFSTINGPRIYDLERRIATIQQEELSIAQYYNQLRCFWDELNLIDSPPNCTCQGCSCGAKEKYLRQQNNRKLMQFLMGLNDTYSQPRSQLLLTSNLPDLSGAYSLLLQDEAQRSHTHPPVSTDCAAL